MSIERGLTALNIVEICWLMFFPVVSNTEIITDHPRSGLLQALNFFLKEYGTFVFIQTNFFFYRSLAVSKILQKKLGTNNDGQ